MANFKSRNEIRNKTLFPFDTVNSHSAKIMEKELKLPINQHV